MSDSAGREAAPAARSNPGSNEAVRGERGKSLVDSARSLQARANHVLAIALMMIVGLGMLGWYYHGAMARLVRPAHSAREGAGLRAANDLQLPPLGPMLEPTLSPGMASAPVVSAAQEMAPDARSGRTAAAPAWLASPAGQPASPSTRAPRTATSSNDARRLGGQVFVRADPPRESSGPGTQASVAAGLEGPGNGPAAGATLLHARLLPDQQLTLVKGAFIDCTLETAIDSTIPGMSTCVTATDTFGADGKVVLLERGTKLIGETRGQVQQGAARVYVLWSEARTPSGVVVPLDSPGADELGRAGLPGKVERHFWERFGAAMLISTINGAVQAAAESAGRGAGTVVYNPTGTQDVLTEVLKNTVNIPPTVIKRQGERIQVLVARDLDFRSVYELIRVGSDR